MGGAERAHVLQLRRRHSTGVLARNLVSTQFWSVRCSTRSNPGGGTNERTGVLYDGIQRRTRTSIS